MMTRRAAATAFLESREGFGWIVILTFAAVLAVIAGCGFYKVSLDAYVDNKTDEKGTALELVDAFVSNYSNLRLQFGGDAAPVPATFRAHSIELFNRTRGASNAMTLRWIGREGRAIATPPADPKMAATIESFVIRSDPSPVSQFLTIGGEQVFRTVYPSVARERSCVDCHNRLQPNLNWQLNDVMGAFSIDAPVGEFLRSLRLESTAIALVVLVLIAGVGLWLSLSHYRRIREREAAREQAEAASQARSSFLPNIAETLRAPLNAIIGSSEIVLSEALGPAPNEKYRAYVSDIHDQGSRLLGVINDVIDLSKAEAGKLDLNDDLFDPRDMLRSIAEQARDRARAAGLTLRLDLPSELTQLRADQHKTRQVLLHLVNKALKFTPPGGTVELICRADRESGLAITVADTGAGMSPERMSRVLEALEQIQSPRQGSQQSSGLGLPLVKAIMRLHGGALELKSEADTGTRATIIFPPERLVFDALRSAA
jgi:signal transduction histidine kinase